MIFKKEGEKLIFGAEFFSTDTLFFESVSIIFDDQNLEIPGNLFDPEAAVFFGIFPPADRKNDLKNDPDTGPVNIYFSADHFCNFFKSFDLYFEDRNSDIRDPRRNLFRFPDLSYKPLKFYNDQENYYTFNNLRNGFTRGFTEIIDPVFSRYSEKISEHFFSYFSKYDHISRAFDGSFKSSQMISEGITKIINMYRDPNPALEKISGHYEIYSEKSNEFLSLFRSVFFDRYTVMSFGDTDHHVHREIKIDRDPEKNSAPKNIFSVSASSIQSGNLQKIIDHDALLNGFTRRIEQLEELTVNKKTRVEIDYDSVVRRLDLELRSALDSCSEGVHF